jgi:hypothetical protein
LLFQLETINKSDHKKISNWSNPNYWLNISNRSRCYQREHYNRFRLKHGLDVKDQIFQSVAEKLREL